MTIDQKALGEATDAILMRVPFGYGMTKPEAGRYAEAAIAAYLAALPASDNAYEAKYNGEGYSFTGNSKTFDHAGLVERAFKDGVRYGSNVENADPEVAWLHSRVREAATALSAGVRVSAAAKRLLDHWDENSGPEKRGEFEGVEYWSPAGRMVDTQFIADLRSALSDAPVVTDEWQQIGTFPGDAPHWLSPYRKPEEPEVRYYDPVLVYGPTWEGGWGQSWPEDGGDFWNGEPRIAIATTYTGKGFWTIVSDAPGDYDTHIKPTHWMPLHPPPAAALGGGE